MRIKERINDFLNKVDLEQLFSEQWKIVPDVKKYSSKIESERENIQEFWEDNQDLRFSQVLVNLGIIPNIPGFWYYTEEEDILEQQGYLPEEVNYWGVYFDKNMKPLKNPYYKPLNQLETDHLKAILDKGFVRNNTKYQSIIKKILKDRNE